MRQNLYLMLMACAVYGSDSLGVDGDLGTTVVTGSGLEESRELATERIHLVTRKDIEAMNASTLQEVVAHLPGVGLSAHPATAAFAEVGMQGLGSQGLKILVDGIEVTGDDAGGSALATIPLGAVERIEVLPGAASALYGSDALGGVVNVITRIRKARPGFTIRARQSAASNLHLHGETQFAQAGERLMIRASTTWDREAGKVVRKANAFGQKVDLYPVPAQSLLAARIGSEWRSGRSFAGVALGIEEQVRTIRDETFFESEYDELHADGTMYAQTNLGAKTDLSGEVYAKSLQRILTQTNLTFGNALPEIKSSYLDLGSEIRYTWRPNATHVPLLGISTRLERLESPDFAEVVEDPLLDIFVQDLISWGTNDKYQLVPGVRYSGILTPKLAFRMVPSKPWVLRASYGMGYRKPTLKQRYWILFHQAPFNFLLRGNPDLKPERSHALNGSVDWSPQKNLRIWGSSYANYLQDMIQDAVVDSAPGVAPDAEGVERSYLHVRSYRNIGRAFTSGGSVGIEYRSNAWRSSLAYSRLVAKQLENGMLVDIPLNSPHSVRALAAYTWVRRLVTLQGMLDYNASQLVSADPRVHTPDYWLMNLSLRKDYGSHLSFTLAVENALDNWNAQIGEGPGNPDQKEWYGLYHGRIYRMEFGANF